MELFTLEAKLKLDTSDYETKIKDIIGQAKRDGVSLDTALNGTGRGITRAQTTTTESHEEYEKPKEKNGSAVSTTTKDILLSDIIKQGIGYILGAGSQSLNIASALREVQNVVDQTYGNGSEVINQWATGKARNYGLSELQAKQFAGYMGSTLQASKFSQSESAEMAMNIAELAGDMASFYNIGIEEAYEKIRSGLSGTSLDPLQGIGINLSVANLEEFSGKDFDKLTDKEKIQTRYDYLLNVTKTAQGDYLRTQDEFANSSRTLANNLEALSAKFGEKLLPMMTAGTNAANSFFDALYSQSAEESLESIDQTARSTADNIEHTATNARAMVGVLEDYGDKSALTAEQQAQWETVAADLIREIPELSGLIDFQTGKIEGGTAALGENIDAWEAAGKAAAETSSIEQKKGMLADISEEIAKEEGMLAVAEKQLAQNQQAVIDLGTQVAQTLGKEFDGTAESARKLILSNEGWYAALKKGLTAAEITEILSPYDEADEAISTHKESIASLQTEYDTVEQSIAEDSAALSESVEGMETDVTASFGNVGSAFDTLVSDLNQGDTAYANAYNTGIGAASGLNDAYPAWAAAMSQYQFTPGSLETSEMYGPIEESDTIAGSLGAAVARSLDGAFVDMDKEHVGQLVLPTVSRGIAKEAQSRRFG